LKFLYYPVRSFGRATLQLMFGQYYTNAAANLARSTEQPATQGVLFTFGSLPGPAPSYTGNVHVVTGEAAPQDEGVSDMSGRRQRLHLLPRQLLRRPARLREEQRPGVRVGSLPRRFFVLYGDACQHRLGISAHTSAPAIYAQIQSYLAGVGF
jgi:hypothetical protein